MSNQNIFTWEDLMNLKVTKEPFLVNPILPTTGIAMLYGPSDSGKSFLCKQLSVSIANNEAHFLDFEILAKHNKVLYVSTEEIDHTSLSRKAQMQGKTLVCKNPKNIKVLIEVKDTMNAIEDMLSKEDFDLVIVDGWADTVQGDTNQLYVVRKSMIKYREMALKHQCCFLLIHHSNKSGEDNQASKKYVSGSHGIENVVRSLFELRKGYNNHREFSILKGNDFSDDFKNGFYRLETDENMVYSNPTFMPKNGVGSKKKETYFDNQDIVNALLDLKMDGKTYDEMAEILETNFDNAPKKTSIVNWFNDRGGNELLEERKKLNEQEAANNAEEQTKE